MPYNLESPNALLELIDPSNIEQWFVRETIQIESEAVRHVLHHVVMNLADFVEWPQRAVLLWDGWRPLQARRREAEISHLS